MSKAISSVTVLTCLIGAGSVLAGGWVDFTDETSLRLPTPLNDAALTTNDSEEKDYAWGDLDNDGDTDLVVVRKQEFTSTGRRVNVLLMNEGIAEGHAINGVLVDRTDDFADTSDVGGDNGFNTATNDRDVVISDVNLDGWLDVITATTLTDNSTKALSHPRVYINLGESGGNWLGLRHEDARIPLMEANVAAGPRFCSVAAGDLTGDGYPDLYFGDYDSGGAQIVDYNNRLLINRGASDPGVFDDLSQTRLTSQMRLSAFGAASVIADINNDGVNDVLKQTSLNAPQHVAITYNDPNNEGFFSDYHEIYAISPYFVSMGDLNNDGLLDIVITDDGTDRYLLNQGPAGAGRVGWTSRTFPNDDGFGGNSWVDDLNKDGFNDVIITDVDVDIAGCSRQTFIFRNLGNLPNVDFAVQGQVIPNNLLTGVHDVAVFDLNGDTWLDIVVGRCNDTKVWINQPPTGLQYAYPEGLPAFVEPNTAKQFQVGLSVIGAGTIVGGSAMQHVSINGGSYVVTPMSVVSGDTYQAELPPTTCTDRIDYFFSAEISTGGTFYDPPSAPGLTFEAVSADGTEQVVRDEIEGDTSAWSVVNDPSLGSGAWEPDTPNGTIDGPNLAAPDLDATAGAENTKAFVTANGAPGESAFTSDVDGGPTYLVSPALDMDGTDGTISFARWFYTSTGEDQFTVEVNNGTSGWVTVTPLTTNGTGSEWETVSFIVSDHVTPSATVQVRFGASDEPNNSVVEAGIDNFQVDTFVCNTACTADFNTDGQVGFADLTSLLNNWGACKCSEDLDGSGAVTFSDLTSLLALWGPCP